MTVGSARRLAIAKSIRPIYETPPRHRPQHPLGRIDLPFIPVQDATHRRQELPDKPIILPKHPIVMDHHDPPQREGRDHLVTIARIPPLRKPFGYPRMIEVK